MLDKMNSNIIDSLDTETRAKIENYSKRCEELSSGVSKRVNLEIPVEIAVEWISGESCSKIKPPTAKKILSSMGHVSNLHDALKEEVDAEIKEIVSFSDSIADKLCVDRNTFFEHFILKAPY